VSRDKTAQKYAEIRKIENTVWKVYKNHRFQQRQLRKFSSNSDINSIKINSFFS